MNFLTCLPRKWVTCVGESCVSTGMVPVTSGMSHLCFSLGGSTLWANGTEPVVEKEMNPHKLSQKNWIVYPMAVYVHELTDICVIVPM